VATKVRRGGEAVDVSQTDVLTKTFSRDNVTYTLKRLASRRDKDNLIAHPLRSAVLIEFEEQLSEMICRLVIAGLLSPSASYLCFTNKRSGNYRELVFPSLIDSIVGRRAIDVLEPGITADDNERVFCGRTHASSTRQPGDYENWFRTWLDYSAEIATAAQGELLAYVFDTDVADFFPAIDRGRAKQFLAQRTGAHASLVDLVFYCLEGWLPRFNYMAMTGLSIEPNDTSRLVAHNYLKIVDTEFPDNDGCKYLRYVDDCTIFWLFTSSVLSAFKCTVVLSIKKSVVSGAFCDHRRVVVIKNAPFEVSRCGQQFVILRHVSFDGELEVFCIQKVQYFVIEYDIVRNVRKKVRPSGW
jgi:hypothetical protein